MAVELPSRENTVGLMDEIDQIFELAASKQMRYSPILACLYTGVEKPASCAPMARFPEPKLGTLLDFTFGEKLASALRLNPAVHDGAVMLGRECADSPYRILGWSYRLFPPETGLFEFPNRGSAFNSCLAMSCVFCIDRVYLLRNGSVHRFEKGLVGEL